MYYLKTLLFSFIILTPNFLLSSPVEPLGKNPPLAVFYAIEGTIEKSYNHLIEKKLQTIDFELNDPHKRVNDHYKIKYGSTALDLLSFMPVVNDKKILPLLNIDPRIAGFSPFNMLIYKHLDENITHVGHLMPRTMLNILGIEDKEIQTKFIDSFKNLDNMLDKELKGKKSFTPVLKLPKKRMMTFEYEFEMPEDIDDFLDEFQNKFALAFIAKGYLIAGFHDFMNSIDDAEDILTNYDAFWSYSLCHFKFSYTMFDNQGARPDAGLFAPCTMYAYIKKESNKVVIGMFRLQTWADTLGIKDEKRLNFIHQLDKEIPEILTSIGMKAIENTNPLRQTAQKKPILVQKTTKITEAPKDTLAVFYTLEGEVRETYTKIIDEDIRSIDFRITDAHHNVNKQYKKKYGPTLLDNLSFLSIANSEVIVPLLNIDPRIAATAPFNMLLYKKTENNTTQIGHLVPEAFLDMIGIEDKEVRKKFKASFVPLDARIEKKLKDYNISYTKSYKPYKKLIPKNMMHFEYDFETPKDMGDFVDLFQEKFELAFTSKGYLMAGYHNLMQSTDNAKEVLKSYDAFWTYSLCHLNFSYNMFDTKDARPDAGIFAPCSMYMYIKKGSNTVVIGMLKLDNWSSTLDIQDKKRLDLIKKFDIQIPAIMKSLGMRKTKAINPLLPKKISNAPIQKTRKSKISTSRIQHITTASGIVEIKLPKVPQAIQLTPIQTQYNRAITFSKRVPPNYIPHRFDKKEKVQSSTTIGAVHAGRISAHLRGDFIDVPTVTQKLKDAGYTILTTSTLNKSKSLTAIVFTDTDIQASASQKKQGFAASLRLLVDSKNQMISITNPLYFAKGFLQDSFDENKAKKILAKIIHHFPNLRNSNDTLKFQILPNYQFMKGMPSYKTMLTVASGENLLEKIKENKKVLFRQTLDNGSTLIGIQLAKRTKKFTQRIGTNNAAMLPYPILIEDNKALILDPKYYIAIMYPKLTMSEFMTIATTPGAIIKECKKIFK